MLRSAYQLQADCHVNKAVNQDEGKSHQEARSWIIDVNFHAQDDPR